MVLQRYTRWLTIAVMAAVLVPVAAYSAETGNNTRLADAARDRNMDAVRSLIKPGASAIDVNAPGSDGTPALHWVVRIDDVDTAKLLIRAGANVSLANRYGVTPLALACSNGNAEMIRVLLDAGADPNALDPGGEPALWGAIRSGTLDAVKVLLDRGALLDFKDSVQQTGLMLAIRENYPDIVQLLVKRGADVISIGVLLFLELIVRGGLPERGSRYLIPGALTPLMFAARDGRLESSRILVEAGARLEVADANEVTPLLMAITNNHPEVARFLIDRGSDINAVDWYGRTPLWAAVEARNMDVDNSKFTNGVDRKPLLELIQICTGGEMPQSAADDDGAAACPLRRLHLLHNRVEELGAEQVVRPIDHCQNGDIATLFARHKCILGQSCLLFAGGSRDRTISAVNATSRLAFCKL